MENNYQPAQEAYRKQFVGYVIKESKPKRSILFDPLALQIQSAKEKITARMELESRRLSSALNSTIQIDFSETKAILQQCIDRSIDSIWTICADDYVKLSSFSVFKEATDENGTPMSAKTFQDAYLSMMKLSALRYEEARNQVKEKAKALIGTWQGEMSGLPEAAQKLLAGQGKLVDRIVQKCKPQAIFAALLKQDEKQYKYRCHISDKTCAECSALGGNIFAVGDAREEVNFPPMHPNCKCSVQSVQALQKPLDISQLLTAIESSALGKLVEVLESFLIPTHPILSVAAGESLLLGWEFWKALVGKRLEETYGMFETFTIDGTSYRFNQTGFQGLIINEKGEILYPEKSAEDKNLIQLLKLMKQRDSFPEGSQARKDKTKEISKIIEQRSLPLDSKKPYTFYIFGGDVTEQLNTYMQQAEQTYRYMHGRRWEENLWEFYLLVKTGAKMDLKAQPEWQHSAFIYNGELISQDALGNINYGYFGTHCNIPNGVLLIGGGVAQIAANTDEPECYDTFYDDPRDSYRIQQGIEIYRQTH